MSAPVVSEDIHQKFVDLQRLLLNQLPTSPGLVAIFRDFISPLQQAFPDLTNDVAVISQISTGSGIQPLCWYTQDLLPPLSPIWRIYMERAVEQGELPSVLNRNAPNISTQDLQQLHPQFMITDNMVDEYLTLVRECGHCQVSILPPISWTVSGINYCHLSPARLRELRQVLVPLHDQLHWTFAHIVIEGDELNQVTVAYYNSVWYDPPLRFMEWMAESFSCLGQIRFIVPQNNPQQPLGWDCGLFMLMGIRLVACGAVHLSQQDADIILPSFRIRVLAEIVNGHLDPLSLDFYESVKAVNRFPYCTNVCREVQESGVLVNLLVPHTPSPPSPNKAQSLLGPTPIRLDSPSPTASSTSGSIPPCSKHMRATSQAESVKALRPERSARSDTAAGFAAVFASQEVIIETLKRGVLDSRVHSLANKLVTPKADRTTELNSCWKKVKAVSANRLLERYAHYEYAVLYAKATAEINNNKKGKKIKHAAMLGRLGVDGAGPLAAKEWKIATTRARRALVWKELVDSFRDSLGQDSCVVLAAVPQSSSVIEELNKECRAVFFAEIQSRVVESKGALIARLRAASELYSLLISDTLPAYTLSIEHIGSFNFEECVSTEEAPRSFIISI